jgi:hypothetical protein
MVVTLRIDRDIRMTATIARTELNSDSQGDTAIRSFMLLFVTMAIYIVTC